MKADPSRRPWYRRIFPVMGLSGLMMAGGGVGWLTDAGVKRLVVPRQYPTEPWMDNITGDPEASGFRLQRFTVTTADQLALQAMLLEPTAGAGTTKRGLVIRAALRAAQLPEPAGRIRGTVILLHGFNARKEHMLPFAERLAAAGFRCVVFDSRGHGDSGGEYATFGIRETDDLQRIIAAADALTGRQGLGPLGLLGYSMGGAVALQAQPTLPQVKAVATVAAFADFREVVTGQASRRWRGAGTPLLPLVRWETEWIAGFDPWQIRPMEAARRLTCPLFLAHGTADSLIPVGQVHQLAAAAGLKTREVMVIPEGTHGNVFMTGGDALWGKLAVFFVRELAAAG